MVHIFPPGTIFLLYKALRSRSAFSSLPENSSKYLFACVSSIPSFETMVIEALYVRAAEIIFRAASFLMNRSAFAVCSRGIKNQRSILPSFESFTAPSRKESYSFKRMQKTVFCQRNCFYFSRENSLKTSKSFCSSFLSSGL